MNHSPITHQEILITRIRFTSGPEIPSDEVSPLVSGSGHMHALLP